MSLSKRSGCSVLLALLLATGAYAQDVKSAKPAPTVVAGAGGAKGKAAAGAKTDEEDELPPIEDTPGVRKTFSRAEIQRLCFKYEGQLIAYYGDVYKVEHCRRRPLMDNKTVYNLQRDGKKVHDVDADVVAALREGEPLDEATSVKTARSCAQLEGRYVTFSSVDVYFVEHCKKRLFPDWATYIKHRETRGDKKGEILSLSEVEFDQLKSGAPIASIVDDLFAKLLKGDAGVEIIPVNEACEGVEGRLTSYYSRVYRIERCRKREIVEPDLYLKKLGVAGAKMIELKSEQWLSLPDGRPIVEKSARLPERAEFKGRSRSAESP